VEVAVVAPADEIGESKAIEKTEAEAEAVGYRLVERLAVAGTAGRRSLAAAADAVEQKFALLAAVDAVVEQGVEFRDHQTSV